MISEKLKKAREYEVCREKIIGREARPVFHMSPRTGWLNDPNGLSVYNGEYHLFYQYHPYDAHWGPMHWGHAVSRDLLHWEYRPAALAPDTPYDGDGCFSGSALTFPDGRHLLMYTGVRKEIGEDGGIRDVQTQCLAVGNGTDYEKYEGNPVLDEKKLPRDASRYDFRDPKIWRKNDGTYRCVVGNCSEEGGQVLLFTSPDGFNWEYQKVLAGDKRFGMMWECPDFFGLDGKNMLLISVNIQGNPYHNGNGVMGLIGDYDDGADTFVEQSARLVDYGTDFYALQTVMTTDGRRVIIGWMQDPATGWLHSRELPWYGQLSVPRELSIKNGKLYQKPIRELEALRGERVEYRKVPLKELVMLEGVRGRTLDMELTLVFADRRKRDQNVTIRFAQDKEHCTSLRYCMQDSMLKLDRQLSGTNMVSGALCPAESVDGRLELRILLDRYSVEVFINGGEQVMTAVIFTEQAADGISFSADGEVLMDLVKYDLYQ